MGHKSQSNRSLDGPRPGEADTGGLQSPLLDRELSPASSVPLWDTENYMQIVKVILLGAPAVGKTSIIQQFVWNEFSDRYVPTRRKETYFPTVIINNHLYELKISDIPVISYFPTNSFCEWTDFRYYGLRSATAYILVYDLSNAETFQYIRTLREQMAESRDLKNVPVLVVGNKQDLVGETLASNNNTAATSSVCLIDQGAPHKVADHAREKRDIVNMVKKHWKCAYIECSAKYNWRIVAVFKELMRCIDNIQTSSAHAGLVSAAAKEYHAHQNFAPASANHANLANSTKCVII